MEPRSISQAGKRVLLIDLGASFGGAEIYLQNLVGPLREQVTFFALCGHGEIAGRLRAQGVTVARLPRAQGVAKIFQLSAALCLLPFLLLRYGIHTVQINGYSEIVLIPLARLLGRTAVATRHLSFEIETDHWYQAPGRFAARFLYRHLARFASRIVCVSEAVGNEVRLLVPPGKVTVIPNWVASLPPLTTRVLSKDSSMKVLFVGRLVEYKGLQLLLDALRTLHQGGSRLLLTVVGEGEGRPQFERLAVGTGSHFVGFQSNVAPFYDAADVFISPSLGPEGSSLVALEAMARSIPCILSDLPVHREIAMNGRAAMLFRSGDHADLASKLHQLAASPSERERYAQAGYLAVRANHNPETAITAYLAVFGLGCLPGLGAFPAEATTG